jgi:alpha-mannosidase
VANLYPVCLLGIRIAGEHKFFITAFNGGSMKGRTLLLLSLIGWPLPCPAQTPGGSEAKQYTAHVVGYAHMDMAWLWRWEESIHDIMYNTFRNQLREMDEHPGYTYAQDQAVVFDQMEHFYPDLFKAMVEKARTGSLIPVSSSWVQMDENLSDGESMVRQFLYGQKYSKEKFGHYVRVAWQPDVFGHPYSMPQIASKAAIDFYLFERPSDPNRSPIQWWQGLDGTRVLGYNPPGWYDQTMDHHITGLTIQATKPLGVKDILILYGEGDHGGGPNPNDIAGIAKLNASPDDVRVKTTNVSDYVDLLLSKKRNFPVLDKEMEGVFTGCYTTQVEMKRHNREAEQLLLNAEKMSELATLFQYQDYVSTRDLSEAWKLVLLNQTHDLAAGSGIGPIYADAANQYEEVFKRGRRALNFALENLGLQVDTQGPGVPVVVYNAQSWDRTDLVTATISGYSLPARMVAVHDQEVLPVQVLEPAVKQRDRETVTVAFVGQKVPQMGLKLYRLVAESAAPEAPVSAVRASTKPRPYLENEFFLVEIDPATGHVARVYDKQNHREVLRGGGASLTALEDTAEQARRITAEYAGPAWDLGLTGKKWEIDRAALVEIVEHGPVRATVRIVHRFRDSEFTQDVSLIAGVPRVDVKMSTDWHERAMLLKAVFPVNASSAKVSAEIPYGAIERDQNGKESVMGKWVDISDANYGVALLNNGRNGYDAEDNAIRLSVIRGPWAPDPRADEGLHTFSYSIYPHGQGRREGKVVQQALAFNSPLIAMQEPVHASPLEQWAGKGGGGLPDSYSFVQTDSDHVVLYAMKQMEGFYDREAIVRFYETEGRDGDVTVKFARPVRVRETNLLEDPVPGLEAEGQTIHFHMKPWEIKTLRVARQ